MVWKKELEPRLTICHLSFNSLIYTMEVMSALNVVEL